MFTGIVHSIGQLTKITPHSKHTQFKIQAPSLTTHPLKGSIAVNGVCLTITQKDTKHLYFDIVPETLKRTNLQNLKIGDYLNLEPALTFNSFLDGHLTQGHIDCTVKFLKKNNQNEFVFATPADYYEFLAPKGSLTLNGTSLTIAKVSPKQFQISIIPETYQQTTFQFLKPNDLVNLEIDLLARYLIHYYESQQKNHQKD